MRPLVLLLALLTAAGASAQPCARLAVSGSATAHTVLGGDGVGVVPAAMTAASCQIGEGDRIGVFALVSPESSEAPRLVALGGTWDILVVRDPLGPYVTVGVAGVQQAGFEGPLCRVEDGCVEGPAPGGRFTTAATVLGGGTRFDLGRGAFVRTDIQVLAGTDLVRPLVSLGGGLRL